MIDKKEIGKRLKIIRKDRGLSQKGLGKLIGREGSEISRWETGKHGIPSTIIGKLCEILKINPNKLYEEQPIIEYPFITKIAAGSPIFSEENKNRMVNINELLPCGPDISLLKVKGDCMKHEGIISGDWVLIKTTIEKLDNKSVYAVAVFSCGSEKVEVTLKKVKKVGNQIVLIPASRGHEIEVYHQSEVQIVGRVIRIIRKL